MVDDVSPVDIYNRYIGQITVAYREDVYKDKYGADRISASRTKNREKYLFSGFKDDNSDGILLIECPVDVLALEFEEHSTTKNKNLLSTKEARDKWIETTSINAKNHNLNYCIADHGGTSRYFYMFNIKGMPEGYEKDAKKNIATKIVPEEALDFIDWTNLGKTLIPIINRPHWKSKYNGEYHKIIEGSSPIIHNNDVSNLIIDSEFIKKKNKVVSDDPVINNIKFRMKVSALMKQYGYDTTKNPTMCKLGHDSKGKSCFSYSDREGLWNCFHCGAAGDILNFVMEHDKVDFKEARRRLLKLTGLTDDFKSEVLQLLLEKDRHKVTEALAERITSDEHVYTLRHDEISEVWIYKEGIYVPQGKTYIKQFCREVLGDAFTSTLANEVIAKIETDTYTSHEEFFAEQNKDLVAVENGILNLRSKTISSFNPDYRFFNKLPVVFDPEKDCVEIKSFFASLFEDTREMQVIPEIFGYLLYREYFIEKAFMFNGNGRNGKGKTLELMKRFIGMDNCCSIPLQTFENDAFSKSELFKKLANLCGDLSPLALKETGVFKELTGRDLISASRKFLTQIKYQNYAKLIFSANKLPDTHDISEAFWDRWIIINFPYTFKIQQELDELKDSGTDMSKYKLRNEHIIDKISTGCELSGLLNWALQGLHRLFTNGDFSYSPSSNATKLEWMRKSSSLHAFMMDLVDVDFETEILKRDFRAIYNMYCKKYNTVPESDKKINNVLISEFGVSDGQTTSLSGKNEYTWTGIKFRVEAIQKLGIVHHITKKDESDSDILSSLDKFPGKK